MKKLFLLLLTTFLFADVKVATAGNAAFAIQALVKVFYEKTHIKVTPIIGSSGKLAAQIENGAPYDVYLSANMAYPEYLFKKNLTITKPVVYAKGKLVLFAKNGVKSIKDLLNATKIAIANPKTAPYGALAIDYLRDQNLYDKLKDKFVIAPNIAAALNYAMRATNYAFIAKSLIFKLPKKYQNKNHYIELDDFYERTSQGAVLLKDREEARKFFLFLFSPQAKEIFKRYGYDVN